VGTFFAEEIAAPAGLDFYIGLPTAEQGRVSQMVIDDPPGAEVAAIPLDQIPEQFRGLVAAFTDPASLMNRTFGLRRRTSTSTPPRRRPRRSPRATGSAPRMAWPGSTPP
jgi:hypothetical protein